MLSAPQVVPEKQKGDSPGGTQHTYIYIFWNTGWHTSGIQTGALAPCECPCVAVMHIWAGLHAFPWQLQKTKHVFGNIYTVDYEFHVYIYIHIYIYTCIYVKTELQTNLWVSHKHASFPMMELWNRSSPNLTTSCCKLVTFICIYIYIYLNYIHIAIRISIYIYKYECIQSRHNDVCTW